MQLSSYNMVILCNRNYWYWAIFLGFIWKCNRCPVFLRHSVVRWNLNVSWAFFCVVPHNSFTARYLLDFSISFFFYEFSFCFTWQIAVVCEVCIYTAVCVDLRPRSCKDFRYRSSTW